MNGRGKFVVIDGGDGTGKSSAVLHLVQELKGMPVLFTREPGGTVFAEQIRDLLLQDRKGEHVFAETELMLFSAARMQHMGNTVIPTLKEGRHVISDRFSLSTIAYQLYGNGRGDLVKFFEMLDTVAVSGCVPDLYIVLDVDTDTALLRRQKAGGLTRFDKKAADFHRAVRAGFLEHLNRYPYGVVVDASKSEVEVQQEVLKIVKNFLKI
ncbi:MAG: dTMP kinase [Parcubacteria group bacterium]|nr:dTMP kinase [Parcubacteria group bacterium]